MQTVPRIRKAFYAILYEDRGTLAQVDGVIYFFGDDGTITPLEPAMCPWVTVLGEVGLAETQRLMDTWRGGHVAIACGRAQEVA